MQAKRRAAALLSKSEQSDETATDVQRTEKETSNRVDRRTGKIAGAGRKKSSNYSSVAIYLIRGRS